MNVREQPLEPPSARSSRPRVRSRPEARSLPGFGTQVLVAAGLLAAWQIVASRTNPILLPSPLAVGRAFLELAASGELGAAVIVSLRDLVAGFALAVGIGILLGFVMARSSTADRLLMPYLNLLNSTPLVALIPLIIIWFGLEFKARLVFIFLLSVWSILLNSYIGVKTTGRLLREVSRVFGLSEAQFIRWVALPHALPYIFAGLRVGLGRAIIGVLISQMQMRLTGLGGLVISYGNRFETAHLLAGVAVSSLFGVVSIGLLSLVQNRYFPWIQAIAGEQRD